VLFAPCLLLLWSGSWSEVQAVGLAGVVLLELLWFLGEWRRASCFRRSTTATPACALCVVLFEPAAVVVSPTELSRLGLCLSLSCMTCFHHVVGGMH
jgi:hypothetical protein